MNQRSEHRSIGNNIQYPVACVMRHGDKELVAEVVNYHYRGACLKLSALTADVAKQLLDGRFKLDFYLGRQCLQSDIPYRVCWDDFASSGMLGVEFVTRSLRTIDRAERFMINRRHPPRVDAMDPLDPNRAIFLEVVDLSETGALLQTSLTNKHMLPGMRLRQATLSMPGQTPMTVDLTVENARKGGDSTSFYLGVSIVGDRAAYKQSLRGYLTQLVPISGSLDEHLSRLSDAGLLSKKLKAGITYRNVSTEAEYEEVLKLRFAGYGRHDKVKGGTTWRDQGEGLAKEGTIIGGFLGGRVICAMELRFGDGELPLRTLKLIGDREIPGIELRRAVEINKLVIHPKAQGSDIVLGMFQRAHAIVVNRGHLDVLLTATDRLARLYEGIGADLLGIKVPHPFLEGENLNLMAVRRQVYHDGLGLNPVAWSTIYQAVHEHFAGFGLASPHVLSRKRKLQAAVTKRLLPVLARFKAKKSKRRRQTVAPAPRSAGGGTFVDPKWTRQEIFATVMHPYVVEATEMIGAEKVDAILDEIGVSRGYIARQGNWLSILFHDLFLEKFSKHADAGDLSRRAGRRAFKRDMLGVNYFMLKHFISPSIAFKSFAKVTQKFNRTRTYEVVEAGRDRVKVAIGLVNPVLLPKRRESCSNWQASFEGFIELMTGKPGRVRKVSCCYEGQRTCSYEVEWQTKPLKGLAPFATLGATLAVGAGSMTTYAHAGAVGAALAAGLLALACLCFALGGMIWTRNRLLEAAARELQNFQTETTERYSELQEAKGMVDEMFREARILEATSRSIQATSGLGDILQTALDAARENFDFDRAFAMLVDDGREKLRTAAVSGIDGRADALWQFSVDITNQRESAVVLSSVFHSGNPIIINEIDAHLFQLNEASRRLIKSFGSRGFIIVAIPAKAGRWGVILVDKIRDDRLLDRRDVKVLERLGQQLGLALDKRADFEREERLRNHFQKYVPAAVVADGLGQESPSLGGQIRDIIAMFVDIRGFTALAQGLSPAATVELLNRFFSVLEPVVTEHGGVIDKFLGDGALVTWGSFGTGAADSDRAMSAATMLLAKIEKLNRELEKDGYAAIEIGIGLHRGPAIVGNIGSANRMEFTCIGSTVNVASRLEALCKSLQGTIVVSDSMRSAVTDGFRRVDGVAIRGVTAAQTVWVYQQGATGEMNESYDGRSAA